VCIPHPLYNIPSVVISVGRAYLYACLVTGESIPIRLFMNGYDLTPTMRDVNKKFSVRYYLNLVLVDDEDRRYFKQQVCICVKCVNVLEIASTLTSHTQAISLTKAGSVAQVVPTIGGLTSYAGTTTTHHQLTYGEDPPHVVIRE